MNLPLVELTSNKVTIEINESFDPMNLIEKVQEIVYDKTNKRLECEVKIIQ